MEYIGVLKDLQKSINEKGLNLLFSDSVKNLKNGFNIEVSTKFLRGLSDLNDTRKTTRRINYLMRVSGLKTKRVYNIFKVRGINKYKTSIVTWGHDKKNKPFPEVVGLTDSEKRQIAEIKAVKEDFGVDLFDHATANLNDRQKRRNAFNYGGGAVVRNVKMVDVGSFAVMRREEVLYMVDC